MLCAVVCCVGHYTTEHIQHNIHDAFFLSSAVCNETTMVRVATAAVLLLCCCCCAAAAAAAACPDAYDGEYQHNCRDGFGKYYYPDNSYYEGHWRNNLKHGEGFYQWCVPHLYPPSSLSFLSLSMFLSLSLSMSMSLSLLPHPTTAGRPVLGCSAARKVCPVHRQGLLDCLIA